ncbi:hypothetical protein M3664_04910 [Paenibacillus lautus]|uniref:hypothetical protein n=1 Tax=Paenibacillus lautus TaxID=1401 RepID=UPI0020414F8A|nr:hypothetical protein [Paenibacillus lautus]MCM3257123.1 hypothetical protein [Paenibacillus lautus]
MNEEQLVKEACAALERLANETEQPGRFKEYTQFCEELLIKILPMLSTEGLNYVINEALDACNLN